MDYDDRFEGVIQPLIEALMSIESNYNPNAVGDGGKAVGILQIHPICVDDVNRIYGTSFEYTDRLDINRSYRICYLYLNHWGKHYEQSTNQLISPYILAQIWNGGAKGWSKTSTRPYAVKVVNKYRQLINPNHKDDIACN